MPNRRHAPIGAPCWIDLLSSDVPSSIAFYGELFGWTAGEPAAEFGGYRIFTKDGEQLAGCMANQPEIGAADGWSVYLSSDDAAKTVETAVNAGAAIVSPAMAVGDLGAMAVIIAPDGAQIGIWQPGTHQGFGVVGETGAPSWFELHTGDYDGAVEFYRDVFRWDTSTVPGPPEFRYTVQQHADDQYAGIMDASGFMAADEAPRWSIYFAVDDTDAALATIERLGGATVQLAQDTPYGRLAVATDPVGARFNLMGPVTPAG